MVTSSSSHIYGLTYINNKFQREREKFIQFQKRKSWRPTTLLPTETNNRIQDK